MLSRTFAFVVSNSSDLCLFIPCLCEGSIKTNKLNEHMLDKILVNFQNVSIDQEDYTEKPMFTNA